MLGTAGSPRHVALKAVRASPSFEASPSCSDSALCDHICRYCWQEDAEEAFVQPCSCSGTTRHVHYKCLVRWVSSGLAGAKRPKPVTHCEICKERWWAGNSKYHELLLATASTELQLSQLYTAAQFGPDEEGADAPRSLWASLEAGLTAYWSLALRPMQAAMLAMELLTPGQRPRGRSALAALSGHLTFWYAGRLSERWVRAYAAAGNGLLSWLAGAASLLLAAGAGGSLRGWLLGRGAADAALWVRLPLSLPLFPHAATLLAALGALFPGRFPSADGLSAAALAPLALLKWAANGGCGLGWLAGALSRLLTQLRSVVRLAAPA